eukprot:8458696-Pyramimonas_sp.AAC.1
MRRGPRRRSESTIATLAGSLEWRCPFCRRPGLRRRIRDLSRGAPRASPYSGRKRGPHQAEPTW